LSPDDRQLLKTVAVDPGDITFKDSTDIIMLNTSASAWSGALGGIVGSMAYEGLHDKTPEGTFLYLLKKDDMLKNTVAEAFRYQLKESHLFDYVEKNNADAFFQVDVTSIQLHEMNGSNLRLTSMFVAKLVSAKDKKILWQSFDSFSGFNDQLIEYPMEEYLSNPSKYKYAISVVSQMIAAEFIKNLGGNPVSVNHALHPVQDTIVKNKISSEPVAAQDKKAEPPSSDLQQKMSLLKRMYDDKLISEEEYLQKKKELLERM